MTILLPFHILEWGKSLSFSYSWSLKLVPYNLKLYIFFLGRYSSYVADLLEDDCTVHHAPWSGDGGSLDTSYLLKCLPMFLSSSVYEPVNYDAIIFNSGLHDINCCGFPREVKQKTKILSEPIMSIITIIDRDVLTAGFDLLSGTISTTVVASDWRLLEL